MGINIGGIINQATRQLGQLGNEIQKGVSQLGNELQKGASQLGGAVTQAAGEAGLKLSDGFEASGAGAVQRGDSGPQVSNLQRQLKAAGFDCGQVDGSFGPKTQKAVKAFQQSRGLDADGVAGPKTSRALAVMGKGSQGEQVTQLQQSLRAAGEQVAVDGVFGDETEAALKSVQARAGVEPDGLVGPRTKAVLANPAAVPAKPAEQAPAPASAPAAKSTPPAAAPETASPAKATSGQSIHVKVPNFSQFDEGKGIERPGNTACFRACATMLGRVGLSPGDAIQVATSEDSHGRVTVDPAKLKQGMAALDKSLAAGKPAIAGVSHKAHGGYNEGITDHYVLITGKGQDARGTYYTFHDPSVGVGNEAAGRDTDPKNRFYLENGKLVRAGGTPEHGYINDRYFELSQILPSAGTSKVKAEVSGGGAAAPKESPKQATPAASATAASAPANGPVSHDVKQVTTVGGHIPVYKVNGGLVSRNRPAEVDADGSPNTYNASNTGLDDNQNGKDGSRWVGVAVNPGTGKPYVQGKDGVGPNTSGGAYISSTTLTDSRYKENDTRHYVDSEKVPFVVIPPKLLAQGAKMGDFVMVKNEKTGKLTPAIVGDQGPSAKLGELSIAAAKALGIPSNPRNGGAESGISYVVFPGSGHGDGVIPSNEEIQQKATALYAKFGGDAQLNVVPK